jgi:MoxR-like ATPase
LGKSVQADCVACLLAGGHPLIEDVLVGKTTLAHALSSPVGCGSHA